MSSGICGPARVEPVLGFEPRTDGLQNRCSTTELNWLANASKQANNQQNQAFQRCPDPIPHRQPDASKCNDLHANEALFANPVQILSRRVGVRKSITENQLSLLDNTQTARTTGNEPSRCRPKLQCQPGHHRIVKTELVSVKFVSKSEFLWGTQCKKLLWYAYNASDQIPEPDAAAQAIFDQSHEVGTLARSLYPDGIEISTDATDLEHVILQPLEAVKRRKPVF